VSNNNQTPSRSAKAIGLAIGAVVTTSLLTAPASYAAENPFGLKSLTKGYMVAQAEAKCGEGKCGDTKAKTEQGATEQKAHEGKCGEGKCGGDEKATEAKCGEGKCGDKKAPEVACGADKKGHEDDSSMADPAAATV